MRAVECEGPAYGETLDACTSCALFWFDPRELEALPLAAPAKELFPAAKRASEIKELSPAVKRVAEIKKLSPAARRAAGMFEFQRLKAEYARRPPGQPDESWKVLPGLFGLPVEVDGHDVVVERPWLTNGLVALLVLVGLAAFRDLHDWAGWFAFRPSLSLPGRVFTSASYFFLHSGWVHLLGNVYFLVIFGDNVEQFLGKHRYALVLLVSTVAGAAAHALLTTRPDLPLIGASGGISGVVTIYALEFPRIRLGRFFWWLLFRGRFWVTFSARAGLIAWFVLQTIGVLHGRSGVSHACHLGGAVAGAALWFLLRERAPRRCPEDWEEMDGAPLGSGDHGAIDE